MEQRPARAGGLGLDDDRHAFVAAIAVGHDARLVAAEQDDPLDAVAADVFDQMVEEGPAADGQHGLGISRVSGPSRVPRPPAKITA